MPTYEYTCKSCGENLEVFQPFSAKALKVHDVCGGELKKVFHSRGVVFKGSGFYATDSRPAQSDSNGSDKSDSKPSDSKKKTEKKEKSQASTTTEAKSSD